MKWIILTHTWSPFIAVVPYYMQNLMGNCEQFFKVIANNIWLTCCGHGVILGYYLFLLFVSFQLDQPG